MADEKKATTLEEVWNNFQPSKVLQPGSPFYVARNSADMKRPQLALKRATGQEKWYLIGHRGCGKSTFLELLLSLELIRDKFHPILYRISDVANSNDLEHQELLFSIASQLIEEGQKYKAIKPKLEKRLENWGRTLVETVAKNEEFNAKVEGGLSAVFAKFLARLQIQHSTRDEFRKIVEPQIDDLIDIINDVTLALEQKLSKPIIVAIDDLDKISPKKADELFENYLTPLEKPACHLIYTVPVALMHKPAWTNLRHRAWYVPNIKLHGRNDRQNRFEEGYDFMQTLIAKRMDEALISQEAVDTIITYGGGVFAQTCILMQTAADFAEAESKTTIGQREAIRAVAELSNGLRTQLSEKDLATLKTISEDNDSQLAFESSVLLHNLSLLRYPNENHWHDVNPVLWEIVDDYKPQTTPDS